jgi:hypothetical protein
VERRERRPGEAAHVRPVRCGDPHRRDGAPPVSRRGRFGGRRGGRPAVFDDVLRRVRSGHHFLRR